MLNYKTTIVKNNPRFVGKKLFLSTELKDKLFNTEDGYYLEIEIDNQGKLSVRKILKDLKKIDSINKPSLRQIGQDYLGFRDPSVSKMLNYLVLPEMEVERIFNNLRYKYLNSIYLSGFPNPSEFIDSKYNKAFQALAGLNVRQGKAKIKRDNDYFWKSVGFKSKAKKENKFSEEYNALNFIITYIRNNLSDIKKIYTELIAIKPGFHELYIHPDYFDKKFYPKGNDFRGITLRFLRGQGNLSNIDLKKLPDNVSNHYHYIRYAPCNVTEGPFVYRKNISVSYSEEIRKIDTKDKISDLKKNFMIFDYKHKNLDSKAKLRTFLLEAEKFRYFM